jgi:hypothetical protein
VASATANDEVYRCRRDEPENEVLATADSLTSRYVKLAIGNAQDGSATAAEPWTLCAEKDIVEEAAIFEPTRPNDGE